MATKLARTDSISSDPFKEVVAVLNTAGELSSRANAALNPGVRAVKDIALALDDADTFVSLLKDLDEAVNMTVDALTLASVPLEGLMIGEIFDGVSIALKGIQKVYKQPLKEIETIEKDTIRKIKPEIDKLEKALQKAQKELRLAAEQLPQYARTVEAQ
jgi:hypothetical protein